MSPLSSTPGIDQKTVSLTTIYTVPSGKTLVFFGFAVRPSVAVSASEGSTVQCIRQSDSSPLCNEIGLSAVEVGQYDVPFIQETGGWPVQPALLVTAGDSVQFSVINPATATSLVATVDLFGYLV